MRIRFAAVMVILLGVPVPGVTDNGVLPKGIIALSGEKAPELKLKDMDGEEHDLRDHRGKWVFVHFWASWCGPCRREMPTIQKMHHKIAPDRLEILLVNTAETDDKVFTFLGIVAPDLFSLMDYDGLVTEQWQPRGLPSTFLIDPAGRKRYVALGGRKWNSDEYVRFLRKIIGAKGNSSTQ